jgi:hypothetical protein
MFTVCLHINILWEIGYLKQLEALGIKTPRRYKKITFIDTSMPKPNR